MTNVDLLTAMEVLDNELHTGAGEADETRALAALDIAQDYFEALAATYPRVKGTVAYKSILTVAATEVTVYPSDLLRLDSLWYVDTTQAPNLPVYPLDLLPDKGGHIPALPWPYQRAYVPGSPAAYWTDEISFYWRPIPDAIYTLRAYGFVGAAAITARGTTFAYPDHLRLPFATFANQLLSIGVADDDSQLKALADRVFAVSLKKMRRFARVAPIGRAYTRTHTT